MKQRLLSSSFKYKEQDPSFIGEELDPRYKNGPIEERKCTDLFCCLIFLLMIGGMIFVGYLGFKTGKPYLLAAPFDEDGRQCGISEGLEDYTKIYISYKNEDPKEIFFVCVQNCPINEGDELKCKATKETNCSSLKIYESEAAVNLCYPQSTNIFEDFDSFMDVSILQEYFADLRDGWPLLAICVGFAIFVSLLFTLFIKYCSKLFVWLTIIGFWLFMVIIGTCSFLIDRWTFLQEILNYESLPHNLRERNYQLGCAILCWTLAFLEMVLVLCCYSKIRISIGILKAAADFTREQCLTILIPICVSLLQIVFLAIWIVTVIYIMSSSESVIEPIENTPFGFVEFNTNIQLYSILYLFGLFWVTFLLEALGNYWTSSTVAIWYYEQPDPHRPISRSLGRAFKQIGSLAFGSLIIAVVVLIKFVFEGITKMLKEKTLGLDQQVGPAKCALKIASCCIACFERIIRFLTENAYIMMAISGKSFCESASESFYLIVRSTAQFAISHGTTKIFILFGKMLICSICCVCGYITLTSIEHYKTNIYSPIFLTIFFSLVSFPIASAFLNLFEMASNTILMCYCLEMDVMKGSNPRCPEALRNFLRNYLNDSVDSESMIR